MAPTNTGDEMLTGINVTPLVDITLVLLIVFMVTAKLIASPSMPLDLPKAANAPQDAPTVVVPSPLNDPAQFNSLIGLLMAKTTATTVVEMTPRLNVNTAPKEVLMTLTSLAGGSAAASGTATAATGTTGTPATSTPGTLAEARACIAEALAALADLPGDALDGRPEAPIALDLPNGIIFDMDSEQYARDWSFPQFYFHCITAYAILRSLVVELGKADYVAHVLAYLRPGTLPQA